MNNLENRSQGYERHGSTGANSSQGSSGLVGAAVGLDLASHAVAKGASAAHGAIKSTQAAAVSALGSLGEKLDQALPALQSVAAQVDFGATAGLQKVKGAGASARRTAREAARATVGYVKREPVTGLMISAAVGAALMLALGWGRRASRLDWQERTKRRGAE